jgi:hypothetical protein
MGPVLGLSIAGLCVFSGAVGAERLYAAAQSNWGSAGGYARSVEGSVRGAPEFG